LGISPKAYLRTGSDILGQVGSSKDPVKGLLRAAVRADEETLILVCVV